MDGCICSRLTSGLAVISVSALVLTPVASRDAPTRIERPVVTLAAQAVPLPPPAPFASPPFDPIGQQVSFHVGFVTDFVVTGVQLFERQLAIPGTFVGDLQNGTSLPVAVARAVQTFAEIELDAGRELVGFAEEYVDFQARFFADLFSAPFVRDIVVGVAALPIAAARVVLALADAAVQLVGSILTGPADATPALSARMPTSRIVPPEATGDEATTRSHDVATAEPSNDGVTGIADGPEDSVSTLSTGKHTTADEPKEPKSVVTSADSVADATVTHGGVKNATTDTIETTDTTDVAAEGKRDTAAEDKDAVEHKTDNGDQERRKHGAEPKGAGDKDATTQSDSAGKTESHA